MAKNAKDLKEERFIVDICFWKRMCKELRLKNKPLLISFNYTSQDNQTLRVFLNNSKVIDEEDSSLEEESVESLERARK